jgi:hypothetical protein
VADTWVPNPVGELLCKFVDTNTSHAKVKYNLKTATLDFASAGPAALIPDTQALSDALLELAVLIKRATNTTPSLNGTGPYDLVKDKAHFVFSASDGSRVTWNLPTLVETILKPDQLYIDPLNADVAAFVAYVKANCLTAEGMAIVDAPLMFRTRPERVKSQL